MRYLVALLALIVSVGCTSGINYVRDAADTVNREAFDGKIVYSVSFKAEPDVAADWHLSTRQIHLHPDWLWQPIIFVKGIIAHEMIHAYLDMPCPGAEDVDEVAAEAPDSRTMHGYKFWTMRREVAEKLGIPTWAIPTGRHHRGTRLDAYWTCQQLETRAKSMQMAAHGEPGAVIVPK